MGYCSRKCQNNSARTKKRAKRELQFIGVDGEGITVETDGHKTHRYVMLSVGDRTLWNHDGLTHHEIFPFLYSNYQPDTVFVGFFLGYDFAMWLRSLSENRGRILLTPGMRARREGKNPVPFPVEVDGWDIDILGLKRFKIRPHCCVKTPCVVCGKRGPTKPRSWMYVCDAGSYFQASFLSVIHPDNWGSDKPCTAEEYAVITAGKANRNAVLQPGDTSYYDEMARYNVSENMILGRAMSILNRGFLSAGVRLRVSDFFGPGQAIQKWLDGRVTNGAHLTHKQIEATVPPWALDVARCTYYGGRFEITAHGHIPGVVYERDIVSAYPHAMRHLPCLCSGKWSRGTGAPPTHGRVTFAHVTVTGSPTARLGPLPFRNRVGNILFPKHVTGWYVWDEIQAANTAGLISGVKVNRWVSFTPSCDHAPLAPLADLFAERQRVGKSTPHGKALKLLLNSAYGKFAQSIGNPKYGNPIYATLITSACRQLILLAIAAHPARDRDVVMIATDGIYFRTPHPTPTGTELGSWEETPKHNLTLMKPGVYWDDSTRNGKAVKSRGISAVALRDNIPTLDRAFADMRDRFAAGYMLEPPTLNLRVPFAVTSPRLALHRNRWDLCGDVQWNVDRIDTASIAPKRCGPYIEDGVVYSRSIMVPAGTETVPYDKRFGFTEETSIDDDIFTPDGRLTDVFEWH